MYKNAPRSRAMPNGVSKAGHSRPVRRHRGEDRRFNSITLKGHAPSRRNVKDRVLRNLDQLGWQ